MSDSWRSQNKCAKSFYAWCVPWSYILLWRDWGLTLAAQWGSLLRGPFDFFGEKMCFAFVKSIYRFLICHVVNGDKFGRKKMGTGNIGFWTGVYSVMKFLWSEEQPLRLGCQQQSLLLRWGSSPLSLVPRSPCLHRQHLHLHKRHFVCFVNVIKEDCEEAELHLTHQWGLYSAFERGERYSMYIQYKR